MAVTGTRPSSSTIQPSHPLWSLLLLPSVFPSIRVLPNESVLHIRWPKCWSFNFSVSPSNEYSELIYTTFTLLQGASRAAPGKSGLHARGEGILRCAGKAGNPFQTTQGNRLSCRDQEGRRWTTRRSNQSILKEISPGCPVEELMIKLKLQYFGHLM